MAKTVAELLESPDNWCQGCYALDEHGGEVGYSSLAACKWCLLGAIFKMLPTSDDMTFQWRTRFGKSAAELVAWNDDPARTHEEVLDFCKHRSL